MERVIGKGSSERGMQFPFPDVIFYNQEDHHKRSLTDCRMLN